MRKYMQFSKFSWCSTHATVFTQSTKTSRCYWFAVSSLSA